MRVTLYQSVTTSLRVSFTQHANDLDDPRDTPVVCSLPKDAWVELGKPDVITVDVSAT